MSTSGDTARPPSAIAEASSIRERLLHAIAANRIPGFHFPGHFLDVRWPTIAQDRAVLELPAGAHVRDAQGAIDRTVLTVLADSAVGTAARLTIAAGARLATVHLHLQFTGVQAIDDVTAEAVPRGPGGGSDAKSWLGAATLIAAGRPVCYASGDFMHLDPPPGVRLAPLPWQRHEALGLEALDDERLTEAERAVLCACNDAQARVTRNVSFIECFWGGERAGTADAGEGAQRLLAVGPHVANRVGHVQGGILLGIATATACDAVPESMSLTNVSAWYLRPGRGDMLTVRSRVVHAGRTTAVARTQVTCPDGSVALEAVTQHVVYGTRTQ